MNLETGNTGLILAGTAIATAASLTLLRSYLWPAQPKIVRSPLKSLLPKLSQDDFNKLEYKPDHFPGGRDVETPVHLPLTLTHAVHKALETNNGAVWVHPRVRIWASDGRESP